MNKQNRIFAFLALILFLSGSFSLIYQIAWVRFLTLLLGSTTLGITTVVSTFMGGLALGSWLASKYLITKDKPLKIYALLELMIALTAFITPLFFRLQFNLLPDLLQRIGEANLSIVILRIIFSAIIMLFPTICMGAALPVLGKYLQKYSMLAERRITVIYGLNTIGACVGCLVSGYFLLRQAGMFNTVYFAAAANALLPLAILYINNLSENTAGQNASLKGNAKVKQQKKPVSLGRSLDPGSRNMILILGGLVGFAGLSSELIWVRLIVLTVGGSVYAYSTILAVYLFFYGAGTALGGVSLKMISRSKGEKTFEISRTVYFSLLMLIPLAIASSLAVANYLPDFYIRNFSIERSSTVFGILINQLFPAILLMSFPTFLLGVFFSYGLFMMKQCSDDPARNTSFLYTWDTVGAILGSIAAAFILIPYLGIDTSLRTTGTVLILSGVLFSFLMKIKQLMIIQISGAFLILIIWFGIPNLNQLLITHGSGIYTPFLQENEAVKKYGLAKVLEKDLITRLIFYRDGFTSTITVTHDTMINQLSISTNGKPDGSSYGDMPTQKLSGHFPMLFHRDPRYVCVIGYGTGTTVGSVALHPNTKVEAVEIEPAMIEGSRLFDEFNNNPLEKDNVVLHITDGRLFLQRNRGKYDVIISEPSNPWLSGVSDLFTVDFYRLAHSALKADGVYAQWIQMYSINPEALQLVLRSFQHVFPEAYMVVPNPAGDLLLIGCKGDYRPELEDIKRRISKPDIAADILKPPVNIESVYQLFARLVFGPEQIRSFAGEGPLNTDVRPILSYMAPLSMFDYDALYENMRKISTNVLFNVMIMGWELEEDEYMMFLEAQREFFR